MKKTINMKRKNIHMDNNGRNQYNMDNNGMNGNDEIWRILVTIKRRIWWN